MNRTALKNYAPKARRDFIQAVTDRAAVYGLKPDGIEPITERGDVAIIGGKPFPISVAEKRRRLEERVKRHGFEQVMEAMAYTWFNRLVAIRYMELHGYLDHGFRVLSNPDPAKVTPEIVEHAEHVDLPGLNKERVIDLKLDGTKEAGLYRMLLIAQCNALNKAMPFLFERIDDETELLLPDNLLHSDSILRKLVTEIEEEDWGEVEIIGWLYQFYISEKKDQVIGKVVKSEDIPAATQLFTPNWIVKYLVQNSLGRKWLATYPDSPLRQKMEFYIEPAEQTPEVQAELKKITPESLNPEDLTMMDPACGSGHILVEGYDVLKEIYLERGYRLRDIPKLILTKNLFGLEIDDRAAQLAAFALLMKARADDRRIFDGDVQTNILSIQESNGLDVNTIVQAFTEKRITSDGDISPGEFGFMGAMRAPLFATENRTTTTADDNIAADLKAVFALFDDAKTYGSLVVVPPRLAEKLSSLAETIWAASASASIWDQASATAKAFLWQATLLARQYDAVVTNPPYMGSKYYGSKLKSFVGRNYADAKADLCTCMIDRAFSMVNPTGFVAEITMHSWMFLSSFEKFRTSLLHGQTIVCMAHLGPSAFPQIGGQVVQVTAFVLHPYSLRHYRGSYRRLLDGTSEEKAARLHVSTVYTPTIADYATIPGSPVAYWASQRFFAAFREGTSLGEVMPVRKGMDTADNNTFLRLWHEVDVRTVGLDMSDCEFAASSKRKWFPYKKGGSFRRWYGNNEYVVNWHCDGRDIIAVGRGTIRSKEFFFRQSLTWSATSDAPFAVRHCDTGFISDAKGSACYPDERDHLWALAYLNTPVVDQILKFLNPTLEFQAGNIAAIPVAKCLTADAQLRSQAADHANRAVALARSDWDSFECSWDFEMLPVLLGRKQTISTSQAQADSVCVGRRSELKQIEEHINKHFIEIYGLPELTPEVPEERVTVHRPDRGEDLRRLVSYAFGCAAGRYSLDKPGLICANSGNEGFDPSQYKTFPADQDGIIPVSKMDWFSDDAAHRFEEFVGVAWPKEHLEENLKFVADSLGPRNGEQPRDTIRRYFADDFFKDHLQTYKRRPIYWLFTSGKLGAFQCLVYLHRYNEGTLARMRTEYVIPLQGKINARIDQLEGDKVKATSTAHRKRIEKEQELLKKQQIELQKFDEKLRHYADQRIKLDLDDGVKVNYGKFGDLLACVTQVCGKSEEE